MRLNTGLRGPQSWIPWLRTLPGKSNPEAGERYLELFIKLGGLQPQHAVLEPGCGTGRMAAALASYLSEEGRYEGFDVIADAIETCNREIATAHPNFRFRHLDVQNPMYNQKGKLDPESFAFPYAAESFDFVFLTSVFTHMLPSEVRRYMSEIRRVLTPNGRSLMTFFLLNPEATAAIQSGRAKRTFEYAGDGYRYDIPDQPERAVGYQEEDVLRLIEDAGLALAGPIQHGGWAGREDAAAGQDVIVAQRIG